MKQTLKTILVVATLLTASLSQAQQIDYSSSSKKGIEYAKAGDYENAIIELDTAIEHLDELPTDELKAETLEYAAKIYKSYGHNDLAKQLSKRALDFKN